MRDSWDLGIPGSPDDGAWDESVSGKGGQRPSMVSAASAAAAVSNVRAARTRQLLRHARRSLGAAVQSARFQAVVIVCAIVALVAFPASVASSVQPSTGARPLRGTDCRAFCLSALSPCLCKLLPLGTPAHIRSTRERCESSLTEGPHMNSPRCPSQLL